MSYGGLAIFSSTALFSALQSCEPAASVDWIPAFLTQDEAAMVERLCGVILPTSDTPGAIEAGVPQLLDGGLASITNDRESGYFRRGVAVYKANLEEELDKKLRKATDEEIATALQAKLDGYRENQQAMGQFFQQMQDEEGEKDDAFVETYFVTQLVQGTFWGYYTSELVGETVMAYDPIPVQYQGCLELQPGQKSWSSV